MLVVEPESTATTSGRLIGPPELLEELDEDEEDELELLEELELLDELDELELELELLLLELLDELEDELVLPGSPPQAVSREAHSTKVKVGVEIAGFIGIIFI